MTDSDFLFIGICCTWLLCPTLCRTERAVVSVLRVGGQVQGLSEGSEHGGRCESGG